jgi:transposase
MNSNKTEIEQKIEVIKIAVDMHLASYRVVRQLDHSAPQPAQKFNPEAFIPWLRKQVQLAGRVVVCYEAGCFGFGPARRMRETGAEVLVIAPQNWDEQGKRQVNDRVDATVMCARLSQYLEGHRKALCPVAIPTPQEEERRAQGRFRDQLRKEVRRLQARGRSLLLLQEIAVRGRWWRGKTWTLVREKTPAWVQHQLEVWKELIERFEARARDVEAKLRQEASAQPPPFFGQGTLTSQMLERELLNPQRFNNGRQVGNYFGLCPSESTTSDKRRLGSITKRGNCRLRRLMIELSWRVVRYQPDYQGAQKFLPVLRDRTASGGARKKAIVAVARHLAVDLWRMQTGRRTAAQLGLSAAAPCLAPER